MKLKSTLYYICLVLCSLHIWACSHPKDETKLKKTVNGFAQTYFNWQLKAALPYCTPASKKWLVYAASQLTQDDIALLKAQDEGASHQVKTISYNEKDTTATVLISVKKAMILDTIGHVGRICKQADYELNCIYRHQNWKIVLNNLPQPIKQIDN